MTCIRVTLYPKSPNHFRLKSQVSMKSNEMVNNTVFICIGESKTYIYIFIRVCVCVCTCVWVTRAEITSECSFYLQKLECGRVLIKLLLNTLYAEDIILGIRIQKQKYFTISFFDELVD